MISILKEEERFYRELYKSNINNPNIGEKVSAFLNDLTIPQLSKAYFRLKNVPNFWIAFRVINCQEMMVFQLNSIKENFGHQ